jgi:WD40 repeat protein/serine/threonine protein kinase
MASVMLDEKAIFNVAREIASPDARAEYLRQACGSDSSLFERVQVLLRAYEGQASFLESPPAIGVSQTIDQSVAETPGTVIGPYKLIESIGEGGMGTVWMAQQTEPVKRLVALKLIKAGMDSRQVIARFEAERQALALMDHANIARVLDAGTTDAGRPYFVMDLVKGVPITRYCDEHHLTPKQRLELFVPVCQAVQHAHQKGIIHRDLKPSNVLVALYDGKPVPKVIDFGVAKAAGQSLTDKTLVTGFGNIVGTLEYMSPEQAEINQLDIDTRSDIYALGVLLYELLAGSPPFTRKELERAGMLEMLRVIREQEPSKPSTKLSTAEGLPTLAANRGTEPAKLTKLLRGELDWIVMKALEKDRNRRYETANGFAADVQRYLADEPVQACPPSAGYRLRKFVRRNKGPVLAATVIFLLLIGGIVGTTLGLLQAQSSEERAQGEAIRAGRERDQANAARAGEQKAGAAEKVQRKLAETAREAEAVQRKLVEARGNELRQNLYFAEMNLAGQAAEMFTGLTRVAELLSHWRSGQPDLRGWEWYYLFGLCHRDLLTIRVSSHGGTKVWDPVTGKEAVILRGPTGSRLPLAWSPDGKLLASQSIVWDAVTGKQRLTFQGHDSVAWAPDGTRLASAGSDGTLNVSDAKTGKTTLILKGHTATVRSVAWSRDGKRLASADESGTVKIWDGATGKEKLTIDAQQHVMAVSWSPDGSRLASAGQSGWLQIWDTATAKRLLLNETDWGPIWSASWSRDGKRLAIGTGGGQVKIGDAATGKPMVTLRGHSDVVRSVAWSPDGTRLASASNDGTVKVWAADQKDEPLPLQAPNPVNGVDVFAVAWSPNGKRLASVRWDSTVKIWDVTTAKEITTFKGHTGGVHAVAWSSDSTCLASGSRDQAIKIWDAATGKELRTLKGHTSWVLSVVWRSDGTRLASADNDGTVIIWDPVTGEGTRTFKFSSNGSDPVNSVSWSPDGTRLASASNSGQVRIWNAATGKPTCFLKGHMDVANSVAWCPTGKRLASAGRDRTVKIWEAATGKELLTLKGHTHSVMSVSWSPDGTRLASAGGGGVKIWDPVTGKEVITFRIGSPLSVAWSPDGLRLATTYHTLIFDAANGYRLAGRSAPGGRSKPAKAVGF